MSRIKVAIIDDDPDFLKVISMFIDNQEDMITIACVTSPNEAITLSFGPSIDVFLIDINLNDVNDNGISLTAKLRLKFDVPILMLTCLNDESTVESAFSAGANYYILKENYKNIPDAIRNIINKEFNPADILAKRYRLHSRTTEISLISPIEANIFDLLKKENDGTRVSQLLNKSPNAVISKISNIKRKIDKFRSIE